MVEIPAHIKSLSPYKPGMSAAEAGRLYGITGVAKLASNENPLGTSPKALLAASGVLDGVWLYPDGGLELRKALAEHLGVALGCVIAHSGSDALIHLIVRTFVDIGDEVISHHGTFIGFQVAARLAGVTAHYPPLNADYSPNLGAMLESINEKTKVMYLANCNNPTGCSVSKAQLEHFIGSVPPHVLVVIDEAYFEFSRYLDPANYPDASTYIDRSNLIVLRTFSKVYGLAGLRVGYAIGHQDLIEPMLRAKLPFEPNNIAAAAAIAALEDRDFVQRTVRENQEGLQLYSEAANRLGIPHAQSLGNFIMLDCLAEHRCQNLFQALMREGFITRPLGAFGLPACLRISTGTVRQSQMLVEALERCRHAGLI